MKCHSENKNNGSNHKHSSMKHMLHMVICCGLPILVVAILPFISSLSASVGGFISRIVPFLCPIMMVSMMIMMFRGNKKESCCSEEKHQVNE